MIEQSTQYELEKQLIKRLQEYSRAVCGDICWEDTIPKYVIAYKNREDKYRVELSDTYTMGTVYFNSKAAALNALTDIIMPFVKEHPEFT